MDAIIGFFALRPTFTFFGLSLVWYLYLLNVVVQAYNAINVIVHALAQRGISWESQLPNFLPLLLNIIVQLALVRLLLEVAAIIISDARTVRQQQ
jgi:hypothetical protein